ncbi:hypothetical protein CsatB_005368 [Cannabis sativa]
MENFELVLEVLKCSLNGIEALGFPNGEIGIVVETEVLDENKTSVTEKGIVAGGSRGFLLVGVSVSLNGVEEVSSRDGVNGVANLSLLPDPNLETPTAPLPPSKLKDYVTTGAAPSASVPSLTKTLGSASIVVLRKLAGAQIDYITDLHDLSFGTLPPNTM